MTDLRRSGRLWFAAGSLFVLGAAAGITGDRLLHRRNTRVEVRRLDLHRDGIRLIDQAVDLRPEQRDRITAILARRQSEVDAAWRDVHENLQRVIAGVIEEIEAELDSSQAGGFRALVEQLHGSAQFGDSSITIPRHFPRH